MSTYGFFETDGEQWFTNDSRQWFPRVVAGFIKAVFTASDMTYTFTIKSIFTYYFGIKDEDVYKFGIS